MKSFIITCPKCANQFEPIEAQNRFMSGEIEKAVKIEKDKLNQKELLLNEKELSLQKEISSKVEAAVRTKSAIIEKQAEIQAAERNEFKIKDLQAQVLEKDQALKESTELQLRMTKKLREADQRQQNIDLEVEQKVANQVDQIQSESMKRAEELYKLKMAEKDKKIKDIEMQLEAAKRTAEQGSQQTQGEVLELEFENVLRTQFPLDTFEPVPKGVCGADLFQIVYNLGARKCGSIIWEFKNTKNFSLDWIQKIKNDQQKISADIAILVTKTLPKDTEQLVIIEGVIVVSFDMAISTARIIRKYLEDISYTSLVNQGKDEKMHLMYNYLTGPQFRHKMKSIANAFIQMKADIDTERRAFNKILATRQKQLEIVIDSASSMYGDIEGIAGSSIQKIEEFSLTASLEIAATDSTYHRS